MSPVRALLIDLVILLLGLLAPARAGAGEPAPAVLEARTGPVDMWPHWRVWWDEHGETSVDAVAAARERFEPARGPRANLGRRAGTTAWLRAGLRLPPDAQAAQWWLMVDYPPLDRVEAYLVLPGGGVVPLGATGRAVLPADRPAATRTLALPLALGRPGIAPPSPGTQSEVELLVKVQAQGTMLVPASLMTTAQLLAHEGRTQTLQGLVLGLSGCVLLFAVVQGVRTRQSTFVWFALSVSASGLFGWSLFGMTTLYLWPGIAWLADRAPPLMTLLTLAAGFMFVERSLDVQARHPRVAGAMHAGAAVTFGIALVFLAGGLSYGAAVRAALVIGPWPMLLALPFGWRGVRRGDGVAAWLFYGWVVYAVGVAIASGVARGWLPLNAWTQHGYTLGGLLQLLCWVNALTAMAVQLRAEAEQAQRERQRAYELAHTDALTRLRNRRGLEAAAAPLLAGATSERPVALFLIDADGFKAVNDTQGHDAGDEVLRQIAARLTQAVRQDDVVARLGGDEFVVITPRLGSAAEAQRIGSKLLAAGQQPFALPGGPAQVGLTVGYALAPQAARDLTTLLKRADSAMYAAKQAGKGRLYGAAA